MGRGEGRQARESYEANSQGAWSWFSPAGKDLETVWVILQNCPALIEDERIAVVVALQPSHWFRLSSQSKSPGISWLQTNRLLLPEGIPPFSSVQFSHSVLSDSLRPHESQHTRCPCPSPTPGVYSNSCPSSRWCHPAISSSVVPFSCPQSLPTSGSSSESTLHIRWPKY